MKKLFSIIFLLFLVACETEERNVNSWIPKELSREAMLLRERALRDNLSVELVESITTEVGPRRIGTEGDKRAIAWAVAKFQELGFDRV
ncbi:MAG: hypothetical protein CMO98_05105 [Woeseia sp.]|nr:hypothetical protein [Woeseia sp.]|tara:strand:- start:498 stop:764 length:267 start_codon:yes stop_codon:yes gene_type:complete